MNTPHKHLLTKTVGIHCYTEVYNLVQLLRYVNKYVCFPAARGKLRAQLDADLDDLQLVP